MKLLKRFRKQRAGEDVLEQAARELDEAVSAAKPADGPEAAPSPAPATITDLSDGRRPRAKSGASRSSKPTATRSTAIRSKSTAAGGGAASTAAPARPTSTPTRKRAAKKAQPVAAAVPPKKRASAAAKKAPAASRSTTRKRAVDDRP